MKPGEEYHTVSFLACVLRSPGIILWGFFSCWEEWTELFGSAIDGIKEGIHPLPSSPCSQSSVCFRGHLENKMLYVL